MENIDWSALIGIIVSIGGALALVLKSRAGVNDSLKKLIDSRTQTKKEYDERSDKQDLRLNELHSEQTHNHEKLENLKNDFEKFKDINNGAIQEVRKELLEKFDKIDAKFTQTQASTSQSLQVIQQMMNNNQIELTKQIAEMRGEIRAGR